MTSTEPSQSKDHNVANITKMIRECASAMRDIKERRKELNEEASEIRERLRNAGVQTPAFDFALRVSDMEAEAKNEYLDALRLNFEALGVGGQSDMFVSDEGASEPPSAPAAPKPAAAKKKARDKAKKKDGAAAGPDGDNLADQERLHRINITGANAAMAGKEREENPHPAGSTEFDLWDRGWDGGDKQAAHIADREAAARA